MKRTQKSPIVRNAEYIPKAEKGKYSELMVLRSNAGYYIGTLYTNDDGFQEPGSRDSEYFQTHKAAQDSLDKETWVQRNTP